MSRLALAATRGLAKNTNPVMLPTYPRPAPILTRLYTHPLLTTATTTLLDEIPPPPFMAYRYRRHRRH